MSRILAITHHAGGVGKTTTALNLGYALGARGASVLLVDLDPQADLSQRFGVNGSGGDLARALLTQRAPVPALVSVPQGAVALALLPADIDSMAVVELGLGNVQHRERRLAGVLTAYRADYQYILIDCPPSLNLLTLNALYAADGVVIPVQAQDKAVRQLEPFLRTLIEVQGWRAQMPPYTLAPPVVGFLLTMVDSTRQASRSEADIRAAYAEQVFRTVIPRRTALADDSRWQAPIAVYDPQNAAALAYAALAKEIDTDAQ